MKINIVGSGVIGIMSAYYLVKLGYDVNIIDESDSFCTKSSGFNSNQLSFSHTVPLITRQTLDIATQFFFGTESNVSVDKNKIFGITPQRIKKIIELLKNTTQFSQVRNSIIIARNSLKSLDNLNKIIEEHKLDPYFNHTGTLHFAKKRSIANKDLAHAKRLFAYGIDYRVWDKNILQNKAKYLQYYNPVSGIFFPLDKNADTKAVVAAIISYLKSTNKVTFYYNEKIKDFILNSPHHVKSVLTNNGEITADALLLCCGAGGQELYKKLQIKIDIILIRGYCYHITINEKDESEDSRMNDISLLDSDNRIVMSRNKSKLKAAGMFEFSDLNAPLNQQNAEYLKNKLKLIFPQYEANINDSELHYCHRAATPNSQPIVKKSEKFNNLFINTGYGSMGWTQSFFGGDAISQIIARYIK